MTYEHPNDNNLKNLHKAMEYNGSDQPAIRTTVSGVTISGDVTVDKVKVEVDAAHNTISATHPVPISANASPNADDNVIYVGIGTDGTVGLNSGSNTIGKVDLNAGSNTIGNVKIVDGSGNQNDSTHPLYVSVTNEIEVKNDSNNPLPISRTTAQNSASNPIYVSAANSSGTTTVSFDAAKTDAFGRLRISDPYTLFDSNFRYSDNTDYWNHSVSGSGAATYDSTRKVMSLNVYTTNDEVVRETKHIFQYQPGKSLLVMTTFCMTAPTSGLRQRVGYFGAQNGVFLETNGTDIKFVIRSNVSGSVVDTEYEEKASWNGDKLNGAGPSGATLDLSKPQILWFDIEWLGVGSVRCGFVIDGQFVLCHTFHHANRGTLVGPYMATACLPLRYEIKATGNVIASLNQICSTVISEGGYEPKSRIRTQSMGVNTLNMTTAGTLYPLMSIRLNSSYTDAIIRLAQLEGIIKAGSATPSNVYYRVVLNASLTGASWTQHSSLKVDYDVSASASTGGTVIFEGYFGASRQIQLSDIENITYQLGRTIAGVSDTFTVVATGDANNVDAAVEMGWYDLS